jgi:hypothetical protein
MQRKSSRFLDLNGPSSWILALVESLMLSEKIINMPIQDHVMSFQVCSTDSAAL